MDPQISQNDTRGPSLGKTFHEQTLSSIFRVNFTCLKVLVKKIQKILDTFKGTFYAFVKVKSFFCSKNKKSSNFNFNFLHEHQLQSLRWYETFLLPIVFTKKVSLALTPQFCVVLEKKAAVGRRSKAVGRSLYELLANTRGTPNFSKIAKVEVQEEHQPKRQ
jgi:hypothetical protein